MDAVRRGRQRNARPFPSSGGDATPLAAVDLPSKTNVQTPNQHNQQFNQPDNQLATTMVTIYLVAN